MTGAELGSSGFRSGLAIAIPASTDEQRSMLVFKT